MAEMSDLELAFGVVVGALREAGFADQDIAWSENVEPPSTAKDFAEETIFVICNSGMKNTVARTIYGRVMLALKAGQSAHCAFGHKGKAGAMDHIWTNRDSLYLAYIEAADKIEYCASIPWIGQITKYHLAKNFGANVAKPDVHLERLAANEGETTQGLCEVLAAATGYRIATVDLLLWRACANGIINSRSETIHQAADRLSRDGGREG